MELGSHIDGKLDVSLSFARFEPKELTVDVTFKNAGSQSEE